MEKVKYRKLTVRFGREKLLLIAEYSAIDFSMLSPSTPLPS